MFFQIALGTISITLKTINDMKLDKLINRIIEDLLEEYAIKETVSVDSSRLSPPGDCKWRYHNSLLRRVRQVCDPQSSCTKPTERKGCGILSKFGKRNVQCTGVRNRINRECFRGGNSGHWQAERDARRAANKCRRLYRRRMCQGRDFYE